MIDPDIPGEELFQPDTCKRSSTVYPAAFSVEDRIVSYQAGIRRKLSDPAGFRVP